MTTKTEKIAPNVGEKRAAFLERAILGGKSFADAEKIWKDNAPKRGATGTTANFYALCEKEPMTQEVYREWLLNTATANDRNHQSSFKGIGNLANRIWANAKGEAPIELKTEKL